MVERLHGMQEVEGSIPFASTEEITRSTRIQVFRVGRPATNVAKWSATASGRSSGRSV